MIHTQGSTARFTSRSFSHARTTHEWLIPNVSSGPDGAIHAAGSRVQVAATKLEQARMRVYVCTMRGCGETRGYVVISRLKSAGIITRCPARSCIYLPASWKRASRKRVGKLSARADAARVTRSVSAMARRRGRSYRARASAIRREPARKFPAVPKANGLLPVPSRACK